MHAQPRCMTHSFRALNRDRFLIMRAVGPARCTPMGLGCTLPMRAQPACPHSSRTLHTRVQAITARTEPGQDVACGGGSCCLVVASMPQHALGHLAVVAGVVVGIEVGEHVHARLRKENDVRDALRTETTDHETAPASLAAVLVAYGWCAGAERRPPQSS